MVPTIPRQHFRAEHQLDQYEGAVPGEKIVSFEGAFVVSRRWQLRMCRELRACKALCLVKKIVETYLAPHLDRRRVLAE
jgi:hypothetical protein